MRAALARKRAALRIPATMAFREVFHALRAALRAISLRFAWDSTITFADFLDVAFMVSLKRYSTLGSCLRLSSLPYNAIVKEAACFVKYYFQLFSPSASTPQLFAIDSPL